MCFDLLEVTSDHRIWSYLTRNRAFGIFSHSETWNSQVSRLFLYSATICEDTSSAWEKVHKVEISLRFCRDNMWSIKDFSEIVFLDICSGSRMKREDEWYLFWEFPEIFHEVFKRASIIDIRWTMDSEEGIIFSLESEIFCRRFLFKNWPLKYQRVDHHISDEMHSFGDSFIFEIFDSGFFCDKKKIWNTVCEDTIYLFGHFFIKRTESRLDMNDFYMIMTCCEGSGDGRIHVSYHEDIIRIFVFAYHVKCDHHLSDLIWDTSSMNPEVDIWWRYAKIRKKSIWHIRIKMLPSVNEFVFDRVFMVFKLPNNRSNFHKVRTSSCDDKDFYHFFSIRKLFMSRYLSPEFSRVNIACSRVPTRGYPWIFKEVFITHHIPVRDSYFSSIHAIQSFVSWFTSCGRSVLSFWWIAALRWSCARGVLPKVLII